MRRSVALQVWAAIVGLILLVLLALGLAADRMLSEFFFETRARELEERGLFFARAIDQDPRLLEALPRIREIVGARVAVYNRSGAMVHQSGFDHGDPAEVIAPHQMQQMGQGIAGRNIRYGGDRHYAVVVPIGPLENPRGWLLLLAPMGPFQQALAELRGILLLAAGGAVLLSAALALVLSFTLVRPLISMQRATRAIARGDYGVQVPPGGENEVGLLAQSINDLSAALARVERHRREFFANISHELRTPLSHIRGYSQALEDGLVEDPAERARYLRVIRGEAERLGRLVEDLMDLAQLEEGRMPLRLQPVDLAELAAAVAGRMGPRAESGQVILATEIPPDLPPLQADPVRLEQVLVNLLDNALRHTPPGGAVTLSAAAGPDAVELAVRDTGAGIPPEELPHIFERFHKVEKSRAQVSGEGRGLGLAIVRSIVRAHGGDVSAESRLGAGTTIRVRLPRLR